MVSALKDHLCLWCSPPPHAPGPGVARWERGRMIGSGKEGRVGVAEHGSNGPQPLLGGAKAAVFLSPPYIESKAIPLFH